MENQMPHLGYQLAAKSIRGFFLFHKRVGISYSTSDVYHHFDQDQDPTYPRQYMVKATRHGLAIATRTHTFGVSIDTDKQYFDVSLSTTVGLAGE
jgi:hypothetical protein